MHRKYITAIITCFSTVLFLGISLGQASTADPEKEASDQAACQEHAKAMSGYDPAATSSPPPQRGAGIRGAAKGAAAGAVTGEVVERVGDEGEHDDAAEVGAAIGAVTGGLKARRNAKQQAQSQAPAGDSSAYKKSYDECMQSRGYDIQ